MKRVRKIVQADLSASARSRIDVCAIVIHAGHAQLSSAMTSVPD
jgi:hypothetical protein